MDHHTLKMSAIRGNDQVVVCPYNPSHQILKSRLQTHLVKCARQHREKEMATCTFNSTHRVPKPELAAHLRECPDRKNLEIHKYTLADESVGGRRTPTISVAAINVQLPASEENWDDEMNATYDPSVHLSQMKVLRTLTGATKAERKKFREEERRRVNQLEEEAQAAAAAEAAAAAASTASATSTSSATSAMSGAEGQTATTTPPSPWFSPAVPHNSSISPSSPTTYSSAVTSGIGRGMLRRPRTVPDDIAQLLQKSRLGMGRGKPPITDPE